MSKNTRCKAVMKWNGDTYHCECRAGHVSVHYEGTFWWANKQSPIASSREGWPHQGRVYDIHKRKRHSLWVYIGWALTGLALAYCIYQLTGCTAIGCALARNLNPVGNLYDCPTVSPTP